MPCATLEFSGNEPPKFSEGDQRVGEAKRCAKCAGYRAEVAHLKRELAKRSPVAPMTEVPFRVPSGAACPHGSVNCGELYCRSVR